MKLSIQMCEKNFVKSSFSTSKNRTQIVRYRFWKSKNEQIMNFRNMTIDVTVLKCILKSENVFACLNYLKLFKLCRAFFFSICENWILVRKIASWKTWNDIEISNSKKSITMCKFCQIMKTRKNSKEFKNIAVETNCKKMLEKQFLLNF